MSESTIWHEWVEPVQIGDHVVLPRRIAGTFVRDPLDRFWFVSSVSSDKVGLKYVQVTLHRNLRPCEWWGYEVCTIGYKPNRVRMDELLQVIKDHGWRLLSPMEGKWDDNRIELPRRP